MEKISQILPSSARVQSAEVTTSQPARPGAPAHGRVEGRSSAPSLEVQDRVTLSGAAKAADAMPNYKNNKADAARVKIVDELAKRFFSSNAIKEDLGEESAAEAVVDHVNVPAAVMAQAKIAGDTL